MLLCVALFTNAHKVVIIERKPVALDRIICAHERYDVMHVLNSCHLVVFGTLFTQWIICHLPRPEIPPALRVVDLHPLAPLTVVIPGTTVLLRLVYCWHTCCVSVCSGDRVWSGTLSSGTSLGPCR